MFWITVIKSIARAVEMIIRKKIIIPLYKFKREGGNVVMLSMFLTYSISLVVEFVLDEVELLDAERPITLAM